MMAYLRYHTMCDLLIPAASGGFVPSTDINILSSNTKLTYS